MARVLIFGDSITQGFHDSQGGWADRLKRKLQAVDKQHSVFNLGVDGDNVGQVLARIDGEINARTKRWDSVQTTIIILAIGTNDTYKEGSSLTSKTPLDSFTKAYKHLLEKAKIHAQSIVVCSILPVDENRSTPVSWKDISYTNDAIEKYNKKIKDLCEQFDFEFIDLYGEAQSTDWLSMIDDGTHPNDKGHQWFCEQVQQRILKPLDSK